MSFDEDEFIEIMRGFDPDDPAQREPLTNTTDAPWEPPTVLRLHRAGLMGKRLVEALRLDRSKVIASFRAALDEEQRANDAGRPIHDGVIG